MKEVFVDTVNKLDHPDFGLRLEEVGVRGWPDEPPSGSSVRSELGRWLNSLDYNRLRLAFEKKGLDAMPVKEFDLKGWGVRFTAIPRTGDQRGSDSRSIIKIRQSGLRCVDASTPIRKKVQDKATRYGDLDRSYVIAVNITDPMLDEIDIMDALFGDEVLSYSVSKEGDESVRMDRKSEGAWVYKGEEMNTRVSAVLIGADVKPWKVAVSPLVLFHNPWAQKGCKGPITQLREYVAGDGEMKKTSGLPPRNIFDLPASWPKAA